MQPSHEKKDLLKAHEIVRCLGRDLFYDANAQRFDGFLTQFQQKEIDSAPIK